MQMAFIIKSYFERIVQPIFYWWQQKYHIVAV